MKKKISFQLMLLVLGIAPVLLVTVISTIMALTKLTDELESGVFEKLNTAAQGLAEYYIYDIEHTGEPDLDEYVDCLKDQDIELTLFKDNERISTSIFKDGSTTERNIGTSADAAIYEEVKKGNVIEKNHVRIGGQLYYVAYRPINANGEFWGMAFAGEKESGVKAAVATAQRMLIITAVVLVLIVGALIAALAMFLKKPMGKAVTELQLLAKGDTTAASNNSSIISELQNIIDASSDLRNALATAIGAVKNSAGVLGMAVQEVDAKTEDNTESVSQISHAINDVSITSQQVAESAQNLATKAVEMGTNIDMLTENISVLAEASDKIKTANDEAANYINTVLKSSAESVSAVNEISEQIYSTNEAIEKIKTAVDAINEIANQTSLLALNASIEAARAGDAGRGFAVVADEIGKLSLQSKASSNQIADIAQDIRNSSEKTVESAKSVSDIINNEQNYIRETQQRFVVLSNSVDASISEIQSIASKTDSLNEIKVELSNSTTDLGAIAEELGASSEEVSASCNVVLSACSDTRAKTEEMTATNCLLNEAVSYFTV